MIVGSAGSSGHGPAPWWRRWWPRAAAPQVWLHAGGVPAADLRMLQRLLDEIGAEQGVRYRLGQGGRCRAALLDLDTATQAPPDAVRARTSALAAVLYERAPPGDGRAWSAQRAELARQLRCLLVPPAGSDRMSAARAPEVPGGNGDAAPLSSLFGDDVDREPDPQARLGVEPGPAERELVTLVLGGLDDLVAPPLGASYGPQAAVRVDFGGWRARLDPGALRGLRVRRALPRLDPAARPGDAAVEVDLDHFVWDLGQACGSQVWLDQPADPWHTPLLDLAVDRVERYSRRSRHLELMRRLQQGPATPEALRRHVHIDVPELRRFVQACLFLGLVRWPAARGGRGLDVR
ncbi:MAG: hypothetical protein U1F56_23665 [Rubrivivax sp.]